MNIQTLHITNTGYSADTVEWCPIVNHRQFFVCGTYHLEENKDLQLPTRRNGRVDLYKYNQSNNNLTKCDSKESAAILDSKWSLLGDRPIVAAATALGEVLLYELSSVSETLKPLSMVHLNVNADTILTLAIEWNHENSMAKKLIASDSKGNASILQPVSSGLEIVSQWNAHSFEAWTCCFDKFNTNVVYTGGDDTVINAYDIRIDGNATKVMSNNTHMAGVTSLISLPEWEHLLATGSYDDHLRIFDNRSFKHPVESIDLKGGVWRIKPDPQNKYLLLCACMYHNISIVGINNNMNVGEHLEIVGEYNEHGSICYGADWCYENIGISKVIATCSFYDQKLCVSKVE